MTTTPNPAPSADTTDEPRQYVARYEDGGLRVLTATQLASDLRHAAHADAEPFDLWTFLAGRPVHVHTNAQQSSFDTDDYADVRVELIVSLTGRVLDVTGYRLDGRV